MSSGKLRIAEINTLIATGKIKVWVDMENVSKTQAAAFLRNGASLLFRQTKSGELPFYQKISSSHLYVSATGFTYNDLHSLIKKNVHIIFNHRGDDAEISSLILKGRNKIVINGKSFSKEELLVFAGKGAQLVLTNELELPDIISFLSIPNKNVLIRSDGFTTAELHSFLKKGAVIILAPDTPEEEIEALYTAGKDKLLMVSDQQIWEY